MQDFTSKNKSGYVNIDNKETYWRQRGTLHNS